MVVRLKIDVKAGRAIRTLREASGRAKDLRKPFTRAAAQSRRGLRGYFNRKGDGAWRNLKPVTRELRGARKLRYSAPSGEGPSRRILHWTQTLRKSLTEKGHANHVARFKGKMIYQFGTSVEYARWHQDGTSKTRGAIKGGGHPKRRPLPDLESELVAQMFIHQVKRHFGTVKGRLGDA